MMWQYNTTTAHEQVSSISGTLTDTLLRAVHWGGLGRVRASSGLAHQHGRTHHYYHFHMKASMSKIALLITYSVSEIICIQDTSVVRIYGCTSGVTETVDVVKVGLHANAHAHKLAHAPYSKARKGDNCVRSFDSVHQ